MHPQQQLFDGVVLARGVAGVRHRQRGGPPVLPSSTPACSMRALRQTLDGRISAGTALNDTSGAQDAALDASSVDMRGRWMPPSMGVKTSAA